MDILPPACIPDDLITDILLLLSIKTIVRLKSVSKSWNTLISDPTFVKQHLKKSSQNPHIVLPPAYSKYSMSSVVSFPVHRLLQNPLSTFSGDNFHGSMNYCRVIGSYNGLLCLRFNFLDQKFRKYQFCLWNPATGTKSIKVGTFKQYKAESPFNFTFGCDISTGTYKVAIFANKGTKHEVSVFSFGDNRWKNIQSFPFPLNNYNVINDGVHLNGTVNWLALSRYVVEPSNDSWNLYIFNAKQSVIVSLDLSTETYTQILLPSDLDEVSLSTHFHPTLQVLMDCLYFLHDSKETQYVIWHMKEFGVQESWTQLFRIDYCKIGFHLNSRGINICPLLPLYFSKNGDTLILADYLDDEIIIYSQRSDMRVERIRIPNKVCWLSAMNYVESLVSTCLKSADIVVRKRKGFCYLDEPSESDYEDEPSDSEFEDDG